jgi:hypothetical protein
MDSDVGFMGLLLHAPDVPTDSAQD